MTRVLHVAYRDVTTRQMMIDLEHIRVGPMTQTSWPLPTACSKVHGPALRVHVGLEAVSDLIADLAAGFRDFGRIAAGVAPHTS